MAAVTVYLARHGQAESNHPHGDRARPLTTEGVQHVGRLAEELRAEVGITRVVASPYVRARRTAEIWSQAYGVILLLEDALGSGSSTGAQVLELARRLGHGSLLVGHNPEMAEAVGRVAGRGVAFPPGSVAAVELGDAVSRMLWLRG